MRRILRTLIRFWPILIALAGTALFVVPPGLEALQPVGYCFPSWQISGYCDPPSMANLIGAFGPEAGVVFVIVLVVALVLRTTVRAALRWRRRRSGTATEAIAADTRPATAWTRNRRRAAAALVVVAVFGAGVGVDRAGLLGGPADSAEFGLIRQGWDLLHTEYVGSSTLDSSELAHAAIGAMADAVGDTGHTYYMTADEAAIQAEDLAGSYIGVGIVLDETGAVPVISVVVPDGPADRGGMQLGDRLLEIDGRSTDGMTDDDLTNALRGEAGTIVMVTVERAAASGTRTSLTIRRGEVIDSAVEWAMVPGTKTAFISLTIFSEGVAEDLAHALRAIHDAQAVGMVLDLRGNPGGIFNEGVDVASQFLSSGVVVQGRDQSGVLRAALKTGWLGDPTTPLVVLIDADSASAAEMVAGGLQDAGRATLVGETTVGTGTVISDFGLDDGSVLSIGIIEWLTRSGRSVWHRGVTPDVVVAQAEGAVHMTPSELATAGAQGVASSRDTQLLAALNVLDLATR